MTKAIADLETQIRRHQALYDKGKPEISDAAFDKLVAQLRDQHPQSAVLDEISQKRAGGVKHATPMLSLDKAYSIDDVLKWARGTGAKLFAVMPKYDGCAVSIRNEGGVLRAATRGDGTVGEDISGHVLHMRGAIVPNDGQEVRGEAIMRSDVFEAKYAHRFANARNLVAGALGRKIPDIDLLNDICFERYHAIGVDLDKAGVTASYARSIDELENVLIRQNADLHVHARCVYEADGLVVRVVSDGLYTSLGATAHHPRGAIALKFQGESGETKLRDVVWQTSRSGTVTPVALLAPIELSGVSISRVTLHHVGRFRSLNLRPHSVVEVTRRGGVIPHIERVVAPGGCLPFLAPSRCPVCDDSLQRVGDFLYCTNIRCPAIREGRLEHWAKTTGMLGWGEELIHQAYAEGAVLTFADFYKHTAETLSSMADIGEGTARNLVDEAKRTRHMSGYVLLAALGIEGVGLTQAQKLLKHFGSLQRFITWCALPESMSKDYPIIPGFSRTRLQSITYNVRAIQHEIVPALKVVTLEDAVPQRVGPLSAHVIVFTGAMYDLEREEARALVRELGGDAPDAVTMKTTILVVGGQAKDEQHTKRDKVAKYVAKGAKITVMPEAEFLQLIEKAREEQ